MIDKDRSERLFNRQMRVHALRYKRLKSCRSNGMYVGTSAQ